MTSSWQKGRLTKASGRKHRHRRRKWQHSAQLLSLPVLRNRQGHQLLEQPPRSLRSLSFQLQLWTRGGSLATAAQGCMAPSPPLACSGLCLQARQHSGSRQLSYSGLA